MKYGIHKGYEFVINDCSDKFESGFFPFIPGIGYLKASCKAGSTEYGDKSNYYFLSNNKENC